MEKQPVERFKKLSQIGFVVRDLEKTVEKMRRVLGAEPDMILQMPNYDRENSGVDGEYVTRIAFYEFCNVQLEFIQPLGGKTIWQNFIDHGREGLHHIRFSVDDYEGTKKCMRDKGIEISSEGPSVRVPGLRWGYFDTEDPLGFIVEMFNEYEKRDTDPGKH